MNLDEARAYVEQVNPLWKASTVDLATRELVELRRDIDQLGSRLTGLNSYADGPRRDLDDALLTLHSEVERLVEYWTEPLREEVEEQS